MLMGTHPRAFFPDILSLCIIKKERTTGLVKSQHPVAKWEHIEKLYKSDRDRPIRVLFKLTDTHLAPVTQCAMKVSLVAQVMSHTLPAGLYTLVAHGK
jgi:hypothetical protein